MSKSTLVYHELQLVLYINLLTKSYYIVKIATGKGGIMGMVELAKPAKNIDFWPANCLIAWRADPQRSFQSWMAEQRVIGERQFRESSQDTYTAMFKWWVVSLGLKQINLLEAAGKDATEFFAAKNFEPVSRRRYLQLLDRVYRYLQDLGWRAENPILVELRKERELDIALPPGLSDAQLEPVIDVLKSIPDWKGARDRCTAALLIGAGLRVSELITLRESDISEDFTITLKPHSIRREHTTLVLPDGPWRAWVRDWRAQRRQLSMSADIAFCPGTKSVKGKEPTPSGVFRRVNLWLEPLGDELPQTGPNLLRNTFARLALTCGRYEEHQVQEFLGHTELRATNRHKAALAAMGAG